MPLSSLFRRRALFPMLLALALPLGACQQEPGGRPTAQGPGTPQPSRSAGPVTTPVPALPAHAIFRPTFKTDRGDVRAGTAFVIRLPNEPRPLLISTMQLLGTVGGLDEEIPSSLIPEAVREVMLQDAFTDSEPVSVGHDVVRIPEAGPWGTRSRAGDVLAVWLPADAKVDALRLATAQPRHDDPLWLAARADGAAPATERLHPARTIGATRYADFTYLFDNPKLDLTGAPGAPVLNAAGEVVALHLGATATPLGLTGSSNAVLRFRPSLEAAAKGESAR